MNGLENVRLHNAALSDEAGEFDLMIEDEAGNPLTDKAEGLAFDSDNPRRAWLVVDRDDPAVPAELLELRLHDGWHS